MKLNSDETTAILGDVDRTMTDEMSVTSKACLVERSVVRSDKEANGAVNGKKFIPIVDCDGMISLKREPVETSDSEDNTDVCSREQVQSNMADSKVEKGYDEHDEQKMNKRTDEDVDVVADKILNLKLENDDEKFEIKEGEGKKSDDVDSYIHIYPADIKVEDEVGQTEDDAVQNLRERGPTRGRPSSFLPGTQAVYSSGYSFQPGLMTNNNFYDFAVETRPGKRRPDDDLITPWKYNRPPEEVNDLDNPRNDMQKNSVNIPAMSGGQVTISTPEINPPKLFHQFSESDANEILRTLETIDQTNFNGMYNSGIPHSHLAVAATTSTSMLPGPTVSGSDVITQLNDFRDSSSVIDSGIDSCSDGYSSEPSPLSDVSVLSPPPSNMSHMSSDSGVSMGSVLSPKESVIMDTMSPRSQTSTYDGMMSSPRSQNGCYDTILDPTPITKAMASPRSQQNGCDNISNLSSSPANSDIGGTCSGFQSPNLNGQNGRSPNASGGCSSNYIDENIDDFRDVMSIVCRDLLETKFKPDSYINLKPSSVANKVYNKSIKQCLTSTACVSSTANIPVSTSTFQSGFLPTHVNKLSVANEGSPIYRPAPQSSEAAVPTTSVVPVSTVIPMTIPSHLINSSTASTSATTAMTSRIVIIPNNQQPQAIVVVNPAPPLPRKPQYVPIKPKLPQPGAATTATTLPTVISGNSSLKTTKANSPKNQKKVSVANSPNSVGQTGQKEVLVTAKKNNSQNTLNIARRLVANMSREQIQYQDKDGDSYLHVAVCKADKFLVQALLERQVREELQYMVDVENNLRQTPLYLAVSANQPDMVSMLIQYKADVNILAECVDNGAREVRAAIHCASSQGQDYLTTLQRLLKQTDINLNVANSDGQTALHCAIRNHGKPRKDGTGIINSIPIIELLIKSGADPNAQDKKSGKTPLMYAMESKNIDLIEKTVKAITAADPHKFRSYLKAQSFDGKSCLRIIESMKAEFNPEAWERLAHLFPSNGRGGASL